jgi:hypothetical protein
MAEDTEYELDAALRQWHLDAAAVRERLNRAPTPRERERWHALWLALQGWSTTQVASALGRDAHTVGSWLADFRREGLAALAFEQTGGSRRPEHGAAGGAQGGGAASATCGRRRAGQLALEGGAGICARVLRHHARSQRLPELPAGAPACGSRTLWSSDPRNACSRQTTQNGPRSWRSTQPCGRRRG